MSDELAAQVERTARAIGVWWSGPEFAAPGGWTLSQPADAGHQFTIRFWEADSDSRMRAMSRESFRVDAYQAALAIFSRELEPVTRPCPECEARGVRDRPYPRWPRDLNLWGEWWWLRNDGEPRRTRVTLDESGRPCFLGTNGCRFTVRVASWNGPCCLLCEGLGRIQVSAQRLVCEAAPCRRCSDPKWDGEGGAAFGPDWRDSCSLCGGKRRGRGETAAREYLAVMADALAQEPTHTPCDSTDLYAPCCHEQCGGQWGANCPHCHWQAAHRKCRGRRTHASLVGEWLAVWLSGAPCEACESGGRPGRVQSDWGAWFDCETCHTSGTALGSQTPAIIGQLKWLATTS